MSFVLRKRWVLCMAAGWVFSCPRPAAAQTWTAPNGLPVSVGSGAHGPSTISDGLSDLNGNGQASPGAYFLWSGGISSWLYAQRLNGDGQTPLCPGACPSPWWTSIPRKASVDADGD